MNIDKNELQAVAGSEAGAAAPRLDLYAGIHKALRAQMGDTLVAVGRMDAADGLDLAEATDRLLLLLATCASHLRHENEFLHTAMQARVPGSAGRIAHEHEEHLAEIEGLRYEVQALRAAAPAAREALALGLYRRLARFVAHNFEHMHVEETEHNAVLWAHYSDAELQAIEGALVASIPPEEMMQVLRWMLPALAAPQRHAMLADMQATAPPPAFAAALEVARAHLSPRDWAKLAQALGLL